MLAESQKDINMESPVTPAYSGIERSCRQLPQPADHPDTYWELAVGILVRIDSRVEDMSEAVQAALEPSPRDRPGIPEQDTAEAPVADCTWMGQQAH